MEWMETNSIDVNPEEENKFPNKSKCKSVSQLSLTIYMIHQKVKAQN